MSHFSINYYAKIIPYEKINDEFTHCKCYILALGKNRNLSHISKEAADSAMSTLFNIPVIGHMYIDEDGNYHMGGHNCVLVEEGGQYKLKSICVPYGVVPAQDTVRYEDVVEPDGEVRTYLVGDIILWTGRYPELNEAIYNEEIYFGQSMEINVTASEPLKEDKNYLDILEYTYSALCLLGKSDDPDYHVEPCFPMARVEAYMYSMDDKFLKLMEELKTNLSVCFNKNTEKGGNSMEDEMAIVETAVEGIVSTTTTGEGTTSVTETVDVAVVEANDADAETVDSESNDPAGKAEGAADDTSSESVVMSEVSTKWTYRDMVDAVIAALPEVEDHYVLLCDFDDQYIYVEICSDDWEEKPIKGRYAYVFDEVTKTVVVTGEFEKMFVKWLTQDELTSLEQLRSQYEALCDYKAERERTDREAAFDAVIAEFDDLVSNEDFIKVVEKKYSYNDVDSLRKECFAIRGMVHTPTTRKTNTEPVIPIGGTSNNQGSARDEFFATYGNRRK